MPCFELWGVPEKWLVIGVLASALAFDCCLTLGASHLIYSASVVGFRLIRFLDATSVLGSLCLWSLPPFFPHLFYFEWKLECVSWRTKEDKTEGQLRKTIHYIL